MMRGSFFFLILLASLQLTKAQPVSEAHPTNQTLYENELKALGRTFTQRFYAHYPVLCTLAERRFVAKVDSARHLFEKLLAKHKINLSRTYVEKQTIEIKYYFDRLLIEYPADHAIYVGKPLVRHPALEQRLKTNLVDFNKPALLTNADFTDYVRAFLTLQIRHELTKYNYNQQNNRHLQAVWRLIPQYITNPTCRTFWQHSYLYSHIDNHGIKNIAPIYAHFQGSCKDTALLNSLNRIYQIDSVGRQGHLIIPYKTVGLYSLDLHLFLPDDSTSRTPRPVMVYFHGGSWSEGKPDWFFPVCREIAQKGGIACAVEYRTYGQHGSLPFEAVKDAKSAIRWLRRHAQSYHIDIDRIVASGNSAGGHLVLCTALADKVEDANDDRTVSAVPNVLLVTAGVYDLTDSKTAWIRQSLANKDLVKDISPLFLIKKGVPPMLLIHGTEDSNTPYATAEQFAKDMTNQGNGNTEFQALKGAAHFIWFDANYAEQVATYRTKFLNRFGYKLLH